MPKSQSSVRLPRIEFASYFMGSGEMGMGLYLERVQQSFLNLQG
jgi:hypothetical protein